MIFKRIILGVSGGIDSAVAGHLLKKKGYEVIGVFMKNWDEIDEKSHCSGEKDWQDAQLVCSHLDIPLRQKDFVKEYWNNVFNELITDYSIGLTPNPDVLCNSLIKFDKFLDYGLTELRGDAIATGHYANSSFGKYLENYSATENVKLLKPSDSFKDQTLFLSQISQAALRKTMLPLGNKKKAEVKQIAKEIGLDFLLKKKESTGICFIGTRNFQDFISDYIDDKEGDFVDIDTGKVVGKHRGIHKWTVGQGCKIGGVKKPYFIAEKYRETNIILIAEGTEHPSLFSDELVTSSIHLVDPKNEELLNEEVACQFRFQHTKNLVNCVVTKVGANLRVKLEKPLRALTPGQYSVFYRGNECLGSARIVERRIMYNLNRLNLKYQVQ